VTDTTVKAQRSPSAVKKVTRDGRAAAIFLLPFVLLACIFILYPVVQAIIMGFFDWDLLTQKATNFGLDNYVKMFGGTGLTWSATYLLSWRIPLLLIAGYSGFRLARKRGNFTIYFTALVIALALAVVVGVHPGADGRWNDPRFWAALQHTIEFTVLSTPLLIALALAMALAVNRPGRSSTLYRTAFFLPYVLPVSVVTMIWIYLYNPNRGLIASVTESLGFKAVDFLNTPGLSLWAVILTTVWWTVGFNLVLFLAGLQDIEPQLYEAAGLDGAGPWQKFRNITVPGLQRITLLVLLTQVVASFQIFGQIFLMTRGGPGDSSLVLIQHVYETGIRNSSLGYASAMSVVLLAIILVASLAQLRLFRSEED